MFTDFKFAFRALRKSPGFTTAAILILALGIGANTSVFSVVEAVILRPLPYSQPQGLFAIESASANQVGLFNIPEFCEFRDQNHSFAGLAAIGAFNTNLVDRGEAQLVQGLRVSANIFDLLGVKPALGRLLLADDDRPDAAKVVVLGNGVWRRSYGGRSDVIGRSILINGEPRTVVGVLPADFILPVNANNNDICVPLQPDADPHRQQTSSVHYLCVIGRVMPGVAVPQAQADVAAIWHELQRKYPNDYPGAGINQLRPLNDKVMGDSRPILLTVLGIVGSLLLLVSVNLAGLLLVRGIGRQRELAIRAALGCSKFQLVRLLAAECFLLACAGGVVGLIVAQWGLDALLALMPAGLPRAHDIQFNSTVLAFTAVVSLVAGLAPGLAPLWLYSRTDLRDAINTGGRASTGSNGQMRLRHVLASIQVGLALALLACTALFLRSFWAVAQQRPGADPAHSLTARLTLPEGSYRDTHALIRYHETLLTRLSHLPGVEQVGVTSLLPLASGLATTEFAVAGRVIEKSAERPSANYRIISPHYFDAMGIALREGRAFTERDDIDHPLCVIIGTALANTFFPEHNAVGQQLQINDSASGMRTFEIVGVVTDVKQQKLEDAPSFDVYIPFRQMDPAAVAWIRYRSYWVMRSTVAPSSLETALRREVKAIDPDVPVASVRTLEQVADSAMAVRRFTLVIIGLLASTALLLTIAGIYAVIAYGVAQRTREIGVRVALGATEKQIMRLVIGEGIGITGTGTVLGIVAALCLAQLAASQLYGVSPHDPPAFFGSTILLFAIAIVACWIPARRATQVDPLVAMRTE